MSANLIIDLANSTQFGLSVVPPTAVNTTSPTTGMAVDLGQADMPTQCIFQVAAIQGTNPTLTLQVTGCNTSGGIYVNEPDPLANPAAYTANGVYIFSYKRVYRYQKIQITIGGTSTPGAAMTVMFLSQQHQTGSGGGSSQSPQT